MNPQTIGLLLLMGFFAITFLQSAVDKVVDRKGNLEWLTGHFKNSPLAKMVGFMFNTITLVEFASGILSSYAALMLVVAADKGPSLMALAVIGLNLLMLLFGQRLAKDYAGASTLGIYMTMVMAGFILL